MAFCRALSGVWLDELVGRTTEEFWPNKSQLGRHQSKDWLTIEFESLPIFIQLARDSTSRPSQAVILPSRSEDLGESASRSSVLLTGSGRNEWACDISVRAVPNEVKLGGSVAMPSCKLADEVLLVDTSKRVDCSWSARSFATSCEGESSVLSIWSNLCSRSLRLRPIIGLRNSRHQEKRVTHGNCVEQLYSGPAVAQRHQSFLSSHYHVQWIFVS